ncbi:MAG: [FeFe] hydrogenase H-cluster maturation GTPase HydF [Ignavibacteriales bacterium]|nr:[FeFe] hydrogenase H-cluster maturation GTPase HydF [Ignavibacteriales bacterium]
MNKVADSNRPHIAVVGRRNVGKSSLVNALLGQDLSIVSEVAGTTTDPVKKALELLPYGPVVLVDTAGIDDEGELGRQRISKTIKILSSSDFALVVVDARETLQSKELELFAYLDKLQINYIVAVNKIEFGVNPELLDELKELRIVHFEVSCKEKAGIDELKRKMIRLLPSDNEPPLVSDIVSQGDVIVLVVPIDLGAPKGRLIMPQVQTIREALDEDTIVVVCKDKELRSTLDNLKNYPDLVITDSQAIMRVAADVPEKVKLTTFSILMARHKGELPIFVRGLRRVEELQNGDKVLVAEACSHHAQEDDIGTVKIPRWLRNHTKKDLLIDVIHGHDFPDNLSDYRLIVHCGGCMLTRRAMQTRINEAKLMDVPIVNYGVLISYMHGAIPRALLPFEEAIAEWEKVKGK